MTDTYTATIDRIVDDQTAVLLLETEADEPADEGDSELADEDADDRATGPVDQLDVAVSRLPTESRHEGAVLEVVLEDGEFRDAEYRPETTRSRREAAQERLDRLSERLSDRD